MDKLYQPIAYLKGVGPAKAELLGKELQIFTCKDLLFHFPFRYVDKTQVTPIKDLRPNSEAVLLRGTIRGYSLIGKGRGRRLVALLEDETGVVELIWFKGASWMDRYLKKGAEYQAYGKPNYFRGKFSLPHPELDLARQSEQSGNRTLQPIYSSTEKLKTKGLDSRGIERLTRELLSGLGSFELAEFVPQSVLQHHKLIGRERALRDIHFPPESERLEQAIYRLKFEEFLVAQLGLVISRAQRQRQYEGFDFDEIDGVFDRFYREKLTFELTGAQKRVLKEIRKDVRSGVQMNRLLQGDVGSGKTIVAVMAMLMAVNNGFQAAIMAPTEILAQQHFESITEALQGLSINVALLTGSVKGATRKQLLRALKAGALHILVGTHALLEDPVQFQNLGLVVIDEQHRFGVAQRARLWRKNVRPPHILVMTATPIPRTLAMTMYGDLDTSVIDELPPGRKEIKTVHRKDSQRLNVFGFLRQEIAEGRQAYIVYPLIEESANMDYKDLMDGYESVVRAFPDHKVAIVHGRMKPADKDVEMRRFAGGECHIMVATTVIEVGVNVPNASVMVIESAERFGLAQLHQLRGRVGRGAEQSYCILMTSDKLSSDARTRIKTMCETTDGFRISEVDMQLRGPGDMRGTRQSGALDFKVADLVVDRPILQDARKTALALVDSDPSLERPEHVRLMEYLRKEERVKGDWSRIS